MAVCYWHTFNWPGSDPFGGQTFLRPWMESGDPLEQAKDKLENAFSFFEKLGIPYFCFHDVDIVRRGRQPCAANQRQEVRCHLLLKKASCFCPKCSFVREKRLA